MSKKREAYWERVDGTGAIYALWIGQKFAVIVCYLNILLILHIFVKDIDIPEKMKRYLLVLVR